MDTSDSPNLAQADGGYASRKFWFSVGTVAVILLEAALCGLWPALIPLYGEMVGGTLGVLALYVTGNVSSKWLIAKSNPAVTFSGNEAPGWVEKGGAKVQRVGEEVTKRIKPDPAGPKDEADEGDKS